MSIEQAIAYHRAGRLVEADAAYRQVLAFQPDNADALRFFWACCPLNAVTCRFRWNWSGGR
jgi:hypothetical protein